MKVSVKTLDNKAAGDVTLADAVFGIEPRADIMARVVNWQLAKRRAGTHKVQIRSEIARTGAKLFRQKGTGNARHGAASSNIFRGGGVVHGPVVRDHGHSLQKKVRALGLKSALSAKARDGKLMVIDSLKSDGKTASLKGKLAKMGLENALIIGGETLDEKFQRAANNIPHIDVLPQAGINVYDILRRDVLVLTKDSAAHLEERLK
ncbi:MAG: 50S ribosomal protein L4 [Alphaproteobacteria bacterium]|jgi:large subunit ribosomal protein L4|nr:50S ribosomal protein L4 [Alphaproteobacteria bacterium]